MPIGTILRIVLTWFQSSNGVCQNTHHFRTVIGGITQTTLETDVSTWVTTMFAQYRVMLPNTCVVQPVNIYEWVTGDGFIFKTSVNATASGTSATDPLPPIMSPMVTARAAGGGVAKKYLPATLEIAQSNGEANAELMARVADYSIRFVTGPNLIRYQPITIKQVGENLITYNNMGLVATIRSTLSHQTRRKRGRGY